jgi:hypothetical protein
MPDPTVKAAQIAAAVLAASAAMETTDEQTWHAAQSAFDGTLRPQATYEESTLARVAQTLYDWFSTDNRNLRADTLAHLSTLLRQRANPGDTDPFVDKATRIFATALGSHLSEVRREVERLDRGEAMFLASTSLNLAKITAETIPPNTGPSDPPPQ